MSALMLIRTNDPTFVCECGLLAAYMVRYGSNIYYTSCPRCVDQHIDQVREKFGVRNG